MRRSKIQLLIKSQYGLETEWVRALKRRDHISYTAVERTMLVAGSGETRFVVKAAMVESVNLDLLYRKLWTARFPTIFPIRSISGRWAIRVRDRFFMLFPFRSLSPQVECKMMEDLVLAFHDIAIPKQVILRKNRPGGNIALNMAAHSENVEVLRRLFDDFDELLVGIDQVLGGGADAQIIHGSSWVGNFFDVDGQAVLIDFDSVRLGNPVFDLVRLIEGYPLIFDDPAVVRQMARTSIGRFVRQRPDRFSTVNLRQILLGSCLLALDTPHAFLKKYVARAAASKIASRGFLEDIA